MRAEATAVAAPPLAQAAAGGLASGAPPSWGTGSDVGDQVHRSVELVLDVFDGPFDLLVTLIL